MGRAPRCASPRARGRGGERATTWASRVVHSPAMPDTAGLGDLWFRASRVRECCEIAVDVTAQPPGWKVVIRSQLKQPDAVDGTGEHLVQAMATAITRAEARGFVRH